jgi:hypothetical protein
MIVDVHGWHTVIYPTLDEIEKLCKPGEGDDTCINLVCGADGFECLAFNQSQLPDHLLEGKGNAKRNGCDFLKKISPVKLGLGKHEIYLD